MIEWWKLRQPASRPTHSLPFNFPTMTSPGAHPEPSQTTRPERSRSNRRRPSHRPSGVVAATTTTAAPDRLLSPAALFESRVRTVRQLGMDSRYSNVELPEVVNPDPPVTGGGRHRRGERTDERRKSRKSDKIFVPAHEARTVHHGDDEEDGADDGPDALAASSRITILYTISHLAFYSILGTLARLGVDAITVYPGAPVSSPVLWSNLGGSLVLGFLTEDRRLFRHEWGPWSRSRPDRWSFHAATAGSEQDPAAVREVQVKHLKVKKTIPLYIGLAAGFCSSFTSFSSLIRDAFLALSNGLASPPPQPAAPVPRHGGYGLEAMLAVLFIHVAVSLCALISGAHLAVALDPVMPTLPYKGIRSVLDPLTVFLGLGSWVAVIFLTAFPPHQHWRRVTFALVFAPIGSLVRFYLSKHLNPRIPSFPFGTFAVNILGTIIMGMCFDLQHSTNVAGGILSCQALQGVMDGFCGCGTTVSTWVAELKGLRRGHAYIYGLTSVVVALLFLISIMGSLQWSRGFEEPVCV